MARPEHYPQEPFHLWDYFYQISQIPRPSKKEAALREHIQSIAKANGATSQVDGGGNLVVYVPGRGSKASDPPIIIQNHLDMVTVKNEDSNFDFDIMGISLKADESFVFADGTTLGSDNGIGCAAALALLHQEVKDRAPLELLFTVDEETGLNGVWSVETQLLKGTRMLNLDSEEWGVLTNGCAGGVDAHFTKTYQMEKPSGLNAFHISLKGLRGGHSGMDAHKQRLNAIQLLAELLLHWQSAAPELSLLSLKGGQAHNVIPRECRAEIVTALSQGELSSLWDEFRSKVLQTANAEDHPLELEVVEKSSEAATSGEAISAEESEKLCLCLLQFWNGVQTYLQQGAHRLPRLSSNLASVLLEAGRIEMLSSHRFFFQGEVDRLKQQLGHWARVNGMACELSGEYPNWAPSPSPLTDLVADAFEELNHQRPSVAPIHAGLECGILKKKIEQNVDVVSFGPTILDAHSPKERVEIASVSSFWALLCHVVSKL